MNNKEKIALGIIEDEVKALKQQVLTLKRLVYELMEEVRGLE